MPPRSCVCSGFVRGSHRHLAGAVLVTIWLLGGCEGGNGAAGPSAAAPSTSTSEADSVTTDRSEPLGHGTERMHEGDSVRLAVEPAARERAIEALAASASADDVRALIAALEDSDSDVAETALDALSDVTDPEAVAELAVLLSHHDVDVRYGAVEALGEIGTDEARAALDVALQDDDLGVRAAARDYLEDGSR